jgi:hypothetical protein
MPPAVRLLLLAALAGLLVVPAEARVVTDSSVITSKRMSVSTVKRGEAGKSARRAERRADRKHAKHAKRAKRARKRLRGRARIVSRGLRRKAPAWAHREQPGPGGGAPSKPPGSDDYVQPPAPLPCGLHVSSRAALLSAAQNTANAGLTVCADAADYGTSDLVFSVRHSSRLTVMATPGQAVTFPQVTLNNVSRFRVQGFSMPRGGFETTGTNNELELVNNDIGGCFCQALRLRARDTGLLFQGNNVHDIRYNGNYDTGWGVKTDGPTIGLQVRYNTFRSLRNDAMEIGSSDDGAIVGNVITDINVDPAYSDPHPDAIMLWSGSERWLIKDNRITDGKGVLMSGSTTDVRMENNLIARIDNLCHDGGTTGSSSAGLVRYTWVRNTMYDCGSDYNGGGFGGGYALISDGPASDNRLERNLLGEVSVDTTAQFVVSDHNLLKNGRRPGATDLAFTPQFADQIDYRPTNLPAGYGDVGYRAAPAGHLAAP